jgi:hypothetical protein
MVVVLMMVMEVFFVISIPSMFLGTGDVRMMIS